MTVARIVPKSEFARIAGVGRSSIGKACKKILAPAVVDNEINLDHPAAQAYLKSKGKKVEKPTKPKKTSVSRPETTKKSIATANKTTIKAPKKKAPAPKPPEEDPADDEEADVFEPNSDYDVGQFIDMTLGDLIARFGTGKRFVDWLSARAKIEDVKAKQLKASLAEGENIPRDMVRANVFGYLDSQNKRILVDSPKTITRKIFSLAKSGSTIEEGEEACRDILSKQLKRTKETVLKVLKEKTNVRDENKTD